MRTETKRLPPTLTVQQLPLLLVLLSGLQFFMGLLEPFFASLGFGSGVARVVRHAHLAPLGVAFIVVLMMPGSLKGMGRIPRGWLTAVILFMVLMFVLGLLRGAFLNAALLDAGAYQAFVVCFVVASRKEHWDWIDKYLRVLFFVGALIMVTQLLVIERAVRYEVTNSVAYEIRAVLFAWPYMLFTIALVKPSQRVATMLGLVLITIMYVVFQKRAPTIRFATALLLFLAFLPGIALRKRGLLRLGAVVIVALVWGATSLVVEPTQESGNLVRQSSAALVERFQSSGGLIETITTENERWVEAGFFFKHADPIELAIGKGFGGAVEVPWWWPPGLEITEAGRVYYGVYSMHIGIINPLLKGGILFGLLFLGGWVVFLSRFRRYKDDPRAMAAWSVLFLNLLFMTVETLWGPANVVTVMLVGFCAGYLSQRQFWEKSSRVRAGDSA